MTSVVDQADAILGGTGFVRCPDSTLVVAGPDAESWLSGQVTQDLRGLEAGSSAYSLVVTVKGKILADLWIQRRDPEIFVLRYPESEREPLMAHFDRYLVMEDVELTPAPAGSLVHVTGSLPALGKALESFSCPRLGVPGVDLFSQEADLPSRCRQEGLTEVGEEGYALARHRQGIPAFGIDFHQTHYPQEAGLEAAVSFTKGCYVGQEVVCMLENRGRLKRRLVLLEGALAAAQTPPGTPVMRDGDSVGELTSVAQDRDRALLFAYVKPAYSEVGAALEVAEAPVTVRQHAAAAPTRLFGDRTLHGS